MKRLWTCVGAVCELRELCLLSYTCKAIRKEILPLMLNHPVFGQGLALGPLDSCKSLLSLLSHPKFCHLGVHIHSLSLSNVQESLYERLPPEWLSVVVYACPNLSCLDLSGCEFVSDALFSSISSPIPSLETLDLSQSRNLTFRGSQSFLSYLPFLKSLTMDDCAYMVNDALVAFLPIYTPHLEFLSIRQSVVTLQGMEQMVGPDRLKNLQTLILDECTSITDDCLLLLGRSGSPLIHLSLTKCHRVSATGLLHFLNLKPDLVHLNIAHLSLSNLTLDTWSTITSSLVLTLKHLEMSIVPLTRLQDAPATIEAFKNLYHLSYLTLTNIHEKTSGVLIKDLAFALPNLFKIQLVRERYTHDDVLGMYAQVQSNDQMVDDNFINQVNLDLVQQKVKCRLKLVFSEDR